MSTIRYFSIAAMRFCLRSLPRPSHLAHLRHAHYTHTLPFVLVPLCIVLLCRRTYSMQSHDVCDVMAVCVTNVPNAHEYSLLYCSSGLFLCLYVWMLHGDGLSACMCVLAR